MPHKKNTADKTFLFVDGTNLYAGQYELFGPGKYLDFLLFIKEIESKLAITFDRIYFYASYSPKPSKPTIKQKHYLKNEAFFYKSVKNTKHVTFFTGYRSKTSGKEKEVDVKLAVDIVDFAHRNYYQNAYLMSGDADFMEALHVLRRLRLPIMVLCIENKIMFKSILFYPTYIITFGKKRITLMKIRNLPKYIHLSENIAKKI